MHSLTEHLDITVNDFFHSGNSVDFPRPLLERTQFNQFQVLPSGRSALRWALEDCGIESEDEVLIPSYTCWAVRSAVESVATPVFVDIELPGYTVSEDQIRSKISKDTEAIVPVHMYGQPCDMEAIANIAAEYNAVIIEDACQALGATHLDSIVGQYSDYCVFSFRFYKEATAYQGGLVLCPTPPKEPTTVSTRFARPRLFAVYLFDLILTFSSPSVYEPLRRRILDPISQSMSKEIGKPMPGHLTDWQRSLLTRQYRSLSTRVEQRRKNAQRYRECLPANFLHPKKVANHSFFRYPILVPETYRINLVNRLRKRGVGCSKMYAYTLPDTGEYPNTEQAAMRMVNLPVHAALNREDIDHIIEVVTETWEKLERNYSNCDL